MNEFKIVPSVEPTDKYQKARKDLIQAKRSFDKLDGEQKDRLLSEFFPRRLIELAKLFVKY